ncbi:hypothetical protein VW23_016500 [Devosia insulae DS-56]|uniref:HEPN domain-containing protein n=1 Tax=Devosia insulae DS-56 TaxID=1116389 RepID=A0A1E5XRY4_9HYPH|nr:hypothetical protein [Devosia insulae]OEO31372.1 hypothetical protein VW23_016500 [Devosia insulae DS-56]
MTLQDREALIEQIIETQPAMRAFLREQPSDLMAGSWDMVSYSFERGFEAMWDLARKDHSGMLDRPLVTLWRQSVELSLKVALLEATGEAKGSHDLSLLFEDLRKARSGLGFNDDDDLAESVNAMLDHVQTFDPFADRFRYPVPKWGQPFPGFVTDLDGLFQAHWIITTWCEGSVMQVRGET